jgi:hypothetical protein
MACVDIVSLRFPDDSLESALVDDALESTLDGG